MIKLSCFIRGVYTNYAIAYSFPLNHIPISGILKEKKIFFFFALKNTFSKTLLAMIMKTYSYILLYVSY